MIEFFSRPEWINPQIDFLLFLQNIRIEHFEHFNKLFLSITIFGEMWLPTLICAVVYWCFNMKHGAFMFLSFGLNFLFINFFKLVACVYRPWVLSDKMKPVASAIGHAKNYSFPSGHSSTAASTLGVAAYLLRRKKVFSCLLIILILLVGFSRLYLGVHTPQDVIVGLTTGFILIFLSNFLINWMDKDKNRYFHVLAVIDILAIFVMLYLVHFNTYPKDYINGVLLVDPETQLHIGITTYGYALGLINGVLLFRKFFDFDPKKASVKIRALRGIIGSIICVTLIKTIGSYVYNPNCSSNLSLITTFLIGFFLTAVYPFIFMKLEEKTAKELL